MSVNILLARASMTVFVLVAVALGAYCVYKTMLP
jgi:hypothetical protein